MSFAGFNGYAIMLATAASFLFGGVWYGAFSKAWMDAAGVDIEKLIKGKNGPIITPYLISLAALLIMSTMLAGIVGHLGAVNLKNGLITGALLWLGFVATSLVVNHAFQGAKPMLTLIDGGHWLGVLLIQGAIIGSFGVP